MDKVVIITYEGGCAGARLVGAPVYGVRHLARPRGGPADPVAWEAANLLVGNPSGTSAVELPLTGGTWMLEGEGWIAFTGAAIPWRINGRPADTHRAVRISGKTVLKGGFSRSGVYGYLSVRGTWMDARENTGKDDAEESNQLWKNPIESEAKIGKDWRSKIINVDVGPNPNASGIAVPTYPESRTLRVYPGPEWAWLTPEFRHHLLATEYTVDPVSSRQGIRLNPSGNWSAVAPALPELISSPVLPGTVQLTPTGLVLLGPDAQTVGGYPRVLVADDGDTALTFQVRPGGTIRLVGCPRS